MFDKLIIRLAKRFLWAGTHFFFGIGIGPSSGEQTTSHQINNTALFDTGEGGSDVSTADNFWKSILSGDPAKTSAVLGPQFAAIAGQAQQNKDTTAAFGNRSGGTNASIQASTDSTRAADNTMIGQLTGTAASTLGSTGTALSGLGLSGEVASFEAQDTIHGQHASQINDIFNSIAQIAASIPGFSKGFSGGSTTDAANLDASASGGYGPGNVAISDMPQGGSVISTGEGLLY